MWIFSRTFEAKFLNKIVALANFASILEASSISGKLLQSLYLICKANDVKDLNLMSPDSCRENPAGSEKMLRKVWKVLFASGPILGQSGPGLDSSASIFCGVRQIFPPPTIHGLETAASAVQVKFLRMPIISSSLVQPGECLQSSDCSKFRCLMIEKWLHFSQS